MCIDVTIYSYQELYVCGKAFCLSGYSELLCKHVTLAQDIHNYEPIMLYDTDANDVNIKRAMRLLKSQYLDTDSMQFIHSKEINFATSYMLIGGIMTNTANRNVSWYLMLNKSLPQDCSSVDSCVSNLETFGGVVNFRKVYLHNRQQYYICAKVQASEVDREFSTEKLDSFSGCSNGFVVDDDPPETGSVTIIQHNNGFVTDPTAFTIAWDGFTDIEKYVNIPFTSGIAGYAYAIGKQTLIIIVLIQILIIIYYLRYSLL